MGYLDIDLNTWSMIVFFFNSMFLISMTLAVFSSIRPLFLVMFFSFILNQVSTLAYGISTKQLGFILIVVFQFFLTLITFIHLNQHSPVYEEDDDED